MVLDDYSISSYTDLSVKICIPSDKNYVSVVSKHFFEFMILHDFYNFDSTVIAFEEALINAIVHGNKNCYAKYVKILIEIYDNSIKISIENEGEGFDYLDAMVKLTQSQENIFQPYGRGIFLISLYTDDFYFEDSGKRIVLIKKNTNEN